MIKKLIKLANHLDSKNLNEEADYLDGMIRFAQLPGRGPFSDDVKVAAAYPGNVGIMEFVKFWQIASASQEEEMNDFLQQEKYDEAWALLKEVTGVDLIDPPGQPQAQDQPESSEKSMREDQEDQQQSEFGSNDFCTEFPEACTGAYGTVRANMPQINDAEAFEAALEGGAGEGIETNEPEKVPDLGLATKAYLNSADDDGEWPRGDQVAVQDIPGVDPASLNPTQTDIYMDNALKKVSAGARAISTGGGWAPWNDSVLVSQDDFLLDGHHRWAATIIFNAENPDNVQKMTIKKVEVPIEQLLRIANAYTDASGATRHKGGGTTACKAIKELVKLANHLDSKGFVKEADYLDGIIILASNDNSEDEEAQNELQTEDVGDSSIVEDLKKNITTEEERIASEALAQRIESVTQVADLPDRISALIEQIEDGLPFPATGYVDASEDNLTLKFRSDRGREVGYFRISNENPDGYLWRASPCRRAWQEVGSPEPIWVVRAAEWFVDSARGKGLAKLAYEVMLLFAGDGIAVGGKCTQEGTSPDAERVWSSFKRRHVSYESMIKLPLEQK